ncbi:MAG: hypothetical protein J6X70_02320 [Muribaculaceae bacterium]|nr:hypothetical protein [Muribaculaceae bacterium]
MEQAKRSSHLVLRPLFKALLVGLFLGGWCAFAHAQSAEIVRYSLKVPFVEEFYFDEDSTTTKSRDHLDFLIEYDRDNGAMLRVTKMIHPYAPDEDVMSDEYAIVDTLIAIVPLTYVDVEALNERITQVFPGKKHKMYAINRERNYFISQCDNLFFRIEIWNRYNKKMVFSTYYFNADTELQDLEERDIAFSQEFVDLMDCLYTICSRSIEGKYPHAILRNAKEWSEQRHRAFYESKPYKEWKAKQNP